MTREECGRLRRGDVVAHSHRSDPLMVMRAGVIIPSGHEADPAHQYGVRIASMREPGAPPFDGWGDCLTLTKKALPDCVLVPEGL